MKLNLSHHWTSIRREAPLLLLIAGLLVAAPVAVAGQDPDSTKAKEEAEKLLEKLGSLFKKDNLPDRTMTGTVEAEHVYDMKSEDHSAHARCALGGSVKLMPGFGEEWATKDDSVDAVQEGRYVTTPKRGPPTVVTEQGAGPTGVSVGIQTFGDNTYSLSFSVGGIEADRTTKAGDYPPSTVQFRACGLSAHFDSLPLPEDGSFTGSLQDENTGVRVSWDFKRASGGNRR